MYQFNPAQQISATKFAAFFQKQKKPVRALRVNETKVTSRTPFLGNLFTLESEKELKNNYSYFEKPFIGKLLPL